MRIARLGALAEPGAAVRRAVPPLEHVAFEELLAGVQHDLRAREARLDEDQRQHVLQLIAIADRAAALVGADAAEQPRGVELIGRARCSPGDRSPGGWSSPRSARAARAQAARVAASSRIDLGDFAARGGGERGLAVGAWPKTIAIVVSRARRELDLAREGGDAPPVVALRAVGCDRFRPSPAYGCRAPGPPKKRARTVSRRRRRRGWSRRRRRRAGNRCADSRTAASRRRSRRATCRRSRSALSLERDVEERRTTRRRMASTGRGCAASGAACRRDNRAGRTRRSRIARSPRVLAKVATPGS